MENQEYEKRLSQVTQLCLILGHGCLLECEYCFVRRSFTEEERKIRMTQEAAQKSIDLWARHIAFNSLIGLAYSVVFHGGEPLMNLPVLEFSLRYIEFFQNIGKLPANLKKIVITNGVLMTQEIAKTLRKYDVLAIVSLDGPGDLHDSCRKGKNCGKTFRFVEKALKILQNEGVEICASTVITPYNINKVREFPYFFARHDIKRFSLNFLMGKSLHFLNPQANFDEYYDRVSEEIVVTFQVAKEIGVYEEQVGRRWGLFQENNPYPLDCYAYGGQLVIHPNGYVSNCHASSRYNIMHVNECGKDFLIGNLPKIKNLRKRLPIYKSDCLNCRAISICGGGCCWSAEELRGNVFEREIGTCVLTKKILDFLNAQCIKALNN